MRNKKQIIQYLGLEMAEEYVGKEGIEANKKYIKAAQRIEQDFYKELADGTHGYGLYCDFAVKDRLEDENEYPVLIEVANYDGVIVYEKVKATLRHLFMAYKTYIIEILIDEKHYFFVEGLDENGCTNTVREEFNIDNIKNFCIEVIDNDGEVVNEIDRIGITLDTTVEELKRRV